MGRRNLSGRGCIRDQLAAAAGMEVVEFGAWDVIAWEFLQDGDEPGA